MPMSARRPCASPGCPHFQGDCPIHVKPAQYGWRQDTTRVRGRKLQRLRAKLFDGEPLCRACAAQGRTTVATIRDHILPLAEGGTDALDNIQPLCLSCSDLKTRAEARRGYSLPPGGLKSVYR